MHGHGPGTHPENIHLGAIALAGLFRTGPEGHQERIPASFLVGVWRGGAPSMLDADEGLLLIDDVFDSGRSLEAVVAELRRRCRRNIPEQIRIATVYYKPSRNQSSLRPDYFVRETDHWLVFPHELCGLTREEILAHKPVRPDDLPDEP